MDTEVLVYLQKVKTYFSSNTEAKDYFIGNSNANDFYKELAIISNKNFETNGHPELNHEQSELLRKTIAALSASKQRIFYSEDNLFMFFDDYPGICMN